MQLHIGGVPEHFNYMWELPTAKEIMRKHGFVYHWQNFPGGTGAMSQALENGTLDVAIMLTEGAIAAKAQGKDFQILFPFVMSPLLWGVFVNAENYQNRPNQLLDAKFAISRYNSGSHLMAKFLAQKDNVSLSDDNFFISNDLEGARKALAQQNAHYFLWEKYMTQPLVRNGEFSMIDEISAPWPSFVFVVRGDLQLDTETWKAAVYDMTTDYLINNAEELIQGICNKYNLLPKEAESWLGEVKYYDNNNYWPDRITAAAIIMKEKGMITQIPEIKELLRT